MHGTPIALDALRFTGSGLHRPECVLSGRKGALYVSDWRGGVTILSPDGSQCEVLAREGGPLARAGAPPVQPNGLAIDRDGSFLLANLGDAGGVWRLHRDGRLEPFCLEAEGEPLPPCNYVLLDRDGGAWISVSTRHRPRALAYRPDVADGFVVRVDRRGARIVADGLGYTNEVQLDASGGRLLVVETFARRVSSFRIDPGFSLSERRTVASFGAGTFPDGLAVDVEGGLWVTSVVSNRVIRIGPDGEAQVLIEDHDPARLATVEEAFLAGKMGRPHLDTSLGTRLHNVSSLAFGGPDGRTAWLGCLLSDSLATFRSPVAGLPPSHWEWT
jgi:sugar lactone lactonase YvrE